MGYDFWCSFCTCKIYFEISLSLQNGIVLCRSFSCLYPSASPLSCSCFLTSDWLLTSSLMLATSFLSPERHILSSSSSSSSPPPPPPAGRWTRNTSLLSSLTLPVPSSHALALHSFPCLPPERERWEGEEERGGQEGEGGIQKRRRGRRKKPEN